MGETTRLPFVPSKRQHLDRPGRLGELQQERNTGAHRVTSSPNASASSCTWCAAQKRTRQLGSCSSVMTLGTSSSRRPALLLQHAANLAACSTSTRRVDSCAAQLRGVSGSSEGSEAARLNRDAGPAAPARTPPLPTIDLWPY